MVTSVRIKDHWAEQRLFLRRVIVSLLLMIGLTGLVVGRLAQLQVIDYEYFSAQSQGNRIRIQPVPPTRGLIFDRNGIVLAENTPSYQLELTPEQVPDIDQTLQRLSAIGLIDSEQIGDLKDLIRSHRRFDAIPIRQRLSETEIARFAVDRPRFPGVEIRARLARNYPYGKAVAHALGYVGGISATDLEDIDQANYAGTPVIGKVSLERTYEPLLHGAVGHENVLVNARGRIMQTLSEDTAAPGQDLVLTLDIQAQLAAFDALDGRRGAVVAIDPANGEVLVFASTPAFDPNVISAGMSRAEYLALQQDPDLPLFNRALRGSYPPGSTIKPIVALAALHYATVDPDKRRLCGGYYTLPGSTHRYRDWKRGGHGLIDMHDSIEQSCDVYFYDLARELGIERMGEFMRSFGLGAPTGIDISGEKGGLVPSQAWKRENFDRREDQVWFPGETIIAGIGQGYMLATPLQLAHAAATIASRGKRYRPTLLRARMDPLTRDSEFAEPERLPDVPALDEQQWDRIISAMHAVMQGQRGTARAVGMDAPFTMAGKSGTAQVFTVAQDQRYDAGELDERMRDHALFIAFAPLEAPQIAVAVVVENGESGSRTAAPIARKVIETYIGEQS